MDMSFLVRHSIIQAKCTIVHHYPEYFRTGVIHNLSEYTNGLGLIPGHGAILYSCYGTLVVNVRVHPAVSEINTQGIKPITALLAARVQ